MERKKFLKALGLGAIAVATPKVTVRSVREQKYVDHIEWFKKHGGLNPMWGRQVERNLEGIAFEKKKLTENAIKLYSQNVKEETWLPHPYKRLFIIYKKQKKYAEATRVALKYLDLWNSWDRVRKYKKHTSKSLIINKNFFEQGLKDLCNIALLSEKL